MKMKRNLLFAAALVVSSVMSSCVESIGGGAVESKLWSDYASNSSENILPDFSYAGYKCGEVAIPSVESLNLKSFDITDYGAVANDGKSDRKAFEKAVKAVKSNGGGIIYIPEGVFDLHAKGDPDKTILIETSNTIIKGAGRDKSKILMSAPNPPSDPKKMWSSPNMIDFKPRGEERKITEVVADAPRGAFSVEVKSAKRLKAGDWVNLTMVNNDRELLEMEMGCLCDDLKHPKSEIINVGVWVEDYHEIKSVDGNIVTFYEPLLYGVESRWGWVLNSYPHLTNVGIEDITFEGDCVADFVHHRSWEDDGAYKPISMVRVVDSWVRRVDYVSVSATTRFSMSARSSAHDIKISGKRGHSSICSQGSSRIFIGKVIDTADAHDIECAGQWHAAGVAKRSLGAVIWSNEWGVDANFESHAGQPRTTLIDDTKGGFLRLRQGGAESQLPNHLNELVIWNFEATATETDRPWQWWDSETIWTRFLPATVVGFHGKEIIFEPSQLVIEESHGEPVEPRSLYEAQLKRRLGELPEWFEELKRL